MLVKIFNFYLNVPVLLLIFIRLSSLLITFPIFSQQFIPMRIKVVLALLLSFLVLTVIPKQPSLDVFSLSMLMLVMNQMLYGILAGFIFSIVFQIFLIGGQIISLQTGLGFASFIDPQMGSINVISRFYYMAGILVFLGLNGHLVFLKLLISSFITTPITSVDIASGQLSTILSYSSEMFTSAIIIALPVIVALLVVNITFAVMTRSAPQFNIFVIGFPITLMFGLFVIYLSFTSVFSHASGLFEQAFRVLQKLIAGG